MKPAPFDYAAATSVEEAVALLSTHEGACLLAGGQSLVPQLALRQIRPTLLVDINPLPLHHIEMDVRGPTDSGEGHQRAGVGELRLGALVRQRTLERDPLVRAVAPLLAEAAGWIGSPAIRHRGTLGGSLAHADPAAELPAVLVALGGSVVVQGPRGRGVIASSDLFRGAHSTALAHDELLVEVRVPAAGAGHGAAFCEWAPRHGDLPDAGVAVTVERGPDGSCASVGAAACGVATTPLDLSTALTPAIGMAEPTDGLLREVVSRARTIFLAGGDAAVVTPARHDAQPGLCRTRDERHDRAELAGLLTARALHRAFARSGRSRREVDAA